MLLPSTRMATFWASLMAVDSGWGAACGSFFGSCLGVGGGACLRGVSLGGAFGAVLRRRRVDSLFLASEEALVGALELLFRVLRVERLAGCRAGCFWVSFFDFAIRQM